MSRALALLLLALTLSTSATAQEPCSCPGDGAVSIAVAASPVPAILLPGGAAFEAMVRAIETARDTVLDGSHRNDPPAPPIVEPPGGWPLPMPPPSP